MYGKFSAAAADAQRSRKPAPVLRREVTLPYDETRTDIAWTGHPLAVAFLTVVVSLLALWTIVKYVVVKPLNHLRNVSDAVARGHIEQRAEIHTAMNSRSSPPASIRMLRHLVDTQAEIRNINENLDAKVDELAQLNMRLYDMNP